MTPIWQIASGLDVATLREQIEQHPEIWNTHRQRTEQYGTPHDGVSDIWVRYRDWGEYTGDWQAFHDEHESRWYPAISKIPAAWSLARKVRRMVGLPILGGVLITKVPPGGQVAPHIDGGWHAKAHRKFGVQVIGGQDQAFCFDGHELRPESGDVYEFRNDLTHWVTNDSDHDRITMIVCCR
jgi:hypothetical protein